MNSQQVCFHGSGSGTSIENPSVPVPKNSSEKSIVPGTSGKHNSKLQSDRSHHAATQVSHPENFSVQLHYLSSCNLTHFHTLPVYCTLSDITTPKKERNSYLVSIPRYYLFMTLTRFKCKYLKTTFFFLV